MDASKDYYAVLGVLPSIEPAAIRAVYLALLKKYHPDVYRGTKEEADRRTKEFNEAYVVLGDEKKREEYDRLRAKSTDQSGDYKNESSNEADDSSDAETLRRWQYVVDYYPEIQNLYASLAKISPALAFSYRITVLERKLSGTGAASKLAETMKNEYMTRYFGNNERINQFVIRLITSGRRDVALEINNAIRILGVPAPDAVSSFLEKIRKKYNIDMYRYDITSPYKRHAEPVDQPDTKGAGQNDIKDNIGRRTAPEIMVPIIVLTFVIMFLVVKSLVSISASGPSAVASVANEGPSENGQAAYQRHDNVGNASPSEDGQAAYQRHDNVGNASPLEASRAPPRP